jgi:redox-sensing transcriptional repressor
VRDIPRTCRERDVTIGMIATPGPAAQGACDLLVRAGVSCILNFAPVVLQVPEQVEVRKVDLAVELQILAFHVARRHLAGSDSDRSGHDSDRSGHDASDPHSDRSGRPAPDQWRGGRPAPDQVNGHAVMTS